MAREFFRTTVTENPYLRDVQVSGPQFVFLTYPAREILYGGAAGGGKSCALLIAALQYVTVKGYNAILFRKTIADLCLPDALIPLSHEFLAGTGAKWNGNTFRWTFPTGATLSFGYLQTENDKHRYKGAAFQFCVARGTPILMADGSYKAIERIRAGDFVCTLEGPKMVSRRLPGRMARCVKLTVNGVSTTVSEDHRILTESGWVCPHEQKPTESRGSGSKYAASDKLSQASSQRLESQRQDPQPVALLETRTHRGTWIRDYDVSRGGEESDSSGYCDSPQEFSPPRAWYGRAVLCERAIPSVSRYTSLEIHPDARGRVACGSKARDLTPDCHGGSYFGDERFLQSRATDQECTPSQDDVVDNSPPCLLEDDRSNTPSHIPLARCRYFHPYTKAARVSREAVRLSELETSPAGEAEVFDLTVEGASHYVSYGGIISQNCGFDELTQFSQSQYKYLFSRLRKTQDMTVPLRMRAASNPGDVGHQWVYDRFVNRKLSRPASCVFIPVKKDENPWLDQATYDESLAELDHITRQQLKHGDWEVRPEGNAFKSEWFRYYTLDDDAERYELSDSRTVEIAKCTRFASADIAGTEAQDHNDPDYTVIQVWDVSPRGDMILVYQWRGRMEIPDVEEILLKVAWQYKVDSAAVEKNGIGLGVVQTVKRRGLNVKPIVAKRDKYARSHSAQIRMEAGGIYFPRHANFLEDLEAELLTFPTKGVHDDQVDALSIASQYTNRIHDVLKDDRDSAEQAEREKQAEADEQRERQEELATITADDDFGWHEVA